jgi:hypothetical protein
MAYRLQSSKGDLFVSESYAPGIWRDQLQRYLIAPECLALRR